MSVFSKSQEEQQRVESNAQNVLETIIEVKCLYSHYPLEGTQVCFQLHFVHKANFLI